MVNITNMPGLTYDELLQQGAKPVEQSGGMSFDQLKQQGASSNPSESSAPLANLPGTQGNHVLPPSTSTYQQDPQGYLQRVIQQYTQAGQNIQQDVESGANQISHGQQQAQQRGFMNTLKGAGNIVLGAGKTALNTAGDVAGAIFAPITAAVEPAVKPIVQKLASIPGVQNNIEGLSAWASQHPEASHALESFFNIITAGVGAEAEQPIKNAVQDTVSTIKSASEKNTLKIAEEASKNASEKSLQETLNLVKPKLTPMEEASAKAAGRGTTEGGLLKRTALVPQKSEVEMAKYAGEAGVNSKNTFDQNIQAMKSAQKTSATAIRSGLEKSDAIWNQNELKGVMDSVEKPLTIKSDSTLNKTAENFKKAALNIANKAEKKTVGLLDVRQDIDDLINKEFPKNIYTKDTPIGQYVRKFRQAINDHIESKIPEGKLPNGQSFRGELRRQNLLYNAIDNVAEKAPKVGESARPILGRIRDFAKKHPIITGGAAALGGERILKKMGAPLP